MIRLADAGDAALHDFCKGSAFGCRIVTAACCYPAAPFAAFWLQRDKEGRITAALSRIEGDVTVCCGRLEPEQKEELGAFLASLGAGSILAPSGTLPQQMVPRTGAVLRFAAEGAEHSAVTKECVCTEKELTVRQLFALFSSCVGDGFEFAATDAAYVDLSHRLRHGFCHAAALRSEGGALCTAAMTVAESGSDALIGGVCTLPEARGKGMASAAVRVLCERLTQKGQTVFLLAENKLIPFYERLGFEHCGEWEQI